jgi:predicted membrane-bound mannosyltransferase
MNLREKLEQALEKHDRIIFLALFGVALIARLSILNAPPLNEKEAVEAWGAWHLLHGQPMASVSALFASFTAGLLFIAGPSHWAPRLLPAVAGSLIVFLPLLGRSTRGRLEAVLAAFLLALSPSFLIVSSMAGGISSGLVAAAFCIF